MKTTPALIVLAGLTLIVAILSPTPITIVSAIWCVALAGWSFGFEMGRR